MVTFNLRRWLESAFRPTSPLRRRLRRPQLYRLKLEQLEDRLAPAQITWANTSGGNFNTAANWDLGRVPATGDILAFPATAAATTAITDDMPGLQVQSVLFNGAGYTIGGLATTTLVVTNQLSSSGLKNNITGIKISLDVGVVGQSINITTTGAGELTIGSKISGGSGSAIFWPVTNAGITYLTGDNSAFNGQITMDAGRVQINNANALGSTVGNTVIHENAQLQIVAPVSSYTINEPLIAGGPGIFNDGAILITHAAGASTPSTVTWAGNITITSPTNTFRIGADNLGGSGSPGTGWDTLEITGVISDTSNGYDITKVGNGRIIFSAANTYRGETIIEDGVLVVRNPLALGFTDGTLATGTLVKNNNNDRKGVLQIEDTNLARNGFTIQDEQLELNGFGPTNAQGALGNLAGNNIWKSSTPQPTAPPSTVTLGTAGVGQAPAIYVNTGTSLLIDTVIDDAHNLDYVLTKIGEGKLILVRPNTYGTNSAGNQATQISGGIVNIRDSKALSLGYVQVNNGTSLELETDTTVDYSVVNSLPPASLDLQLPTDMQVSNLVYLVGNGYNNTGGALRNVQGTNEWLGTVSDLGNFSIGVDPDPDPSNTNPAKSSLAYDDFSRLTIKGSIQSGSTMTKLGKGELVLPRANSNFTGLAVISSGWVTIKDPQALGVNIFGRGDTVQPGTTVASGAALVLMQTPAPGNANLNFSENLTLAGLGIPGAEMANVSRRPEILAMGALVNLSGDNVANYDIKFNGIVGIGVTDQTFGLSGPAPNSSLVLKGSLSEIVAASGLTKLGGRRLVIQADGTYTGPVDIAAGVLELRSDTGLGQSPTQAQTTTTVELGAALVLGPQIPQFNGGIPDTVVGHAGLQTWFEKLIVDSSGNASDYLAPIKAVTILSDDHLWRGPVSLKRDLNIGIPASARITFLSTIDDASAPSPAGITMDIGTPDTGGKLVLAGANSYRGVTDIKSGIVNIQNSQALGSAAGGTVVDLGASLEVQGNLVINEPLNIQGTGITSVPFSPPVSRWFSLGPEPIAPLPSPYIGDTPGNGNTTGRITGVAVDSSDSNVMYVATAGGGVWKTKNNGTTWQQMLDFSSGATNQTTFEGAIAIAPTDNTYLYAGSGEANNVSDSYYGRGLYRSTDSGKTWTQILGPTGNPSLSSTFLDRLTISKIVVSQFNRNIVYVAVCQNGSNGRAGSAANPTGVYRVDFSGGGNGSWTNLIANADWTNVAPNGDPSNPPPFGIPTTSDDYTDVVVSNNGNIISFAVGDAAGSLRNGVYTSLNGGINFILNSFPQADVVSGVNYPHNGVIKLAMQDAGNTWTLYAAVTYPTNYPPNPPLAGQFREIQKAIIVNTPPIQFTAPWGVITAVPPNYMGSVGYYNTTIGVDPSNANNVYVAGLGYPTSVGPFYSNNGGASWTDIKGTNPNIPGPHGQAHVMTFSGSKLLLGTDGGLWRLENPATPSWTDLNGTLLDITQFNGIDVDATQPQIVIGGSQSNGTEIYLGNSPTWTQTDDGQTAAAANSGGAVRIDPSTPLTYGVSGNVYHLQGTNLRKSTDGGKTWVTIRAGNSFFLDNVNTARLLVNNGNVSESLDRGVNWTNLGGAAGSLVVAGATYQGPFVADPSFPLVTDHGANNYETDTIWTLGFNAIGITKNHGINWVSRFVGATNLVDLIVDPSNRDTAYVVRAAFGGAKVFRTTNAGQSWTDITGNLPDLPVWTIVQDPRNSDLYIGNDNGVYKLPGTNLTANQFNNWAKFGAGLPFSQVRDLVLNTNLDTLTAGTYGRGAYQIALDSFVANAGVIRAISGDSFLTNNVILSGATTIGVEGSQTINGIAASLSILGSVSGAYDLTKISGGTLVLAGDNSGAPGGLPPLDGVIRVMEGVLAVQNPHALGSVTKPTLVDSDISGLRKGASLELRSDVLDEPLELFGDGFKFNGHFTGSLRDLTGSYSYTGPILVKPNTVTNGGVTIGVGPGRTLTITGSISEENQGSLHTDITKELTGKLVLTADNTYVGMTHVNQGILNIQNDYALGHTDNSLSGVKQGTEVLNGAQLQLEGGITVQNEKLDLSGIGFQNDNTGALRNISGINTWQGPVNLTELRGFLPTTIPSAIVSIGVDTPTSILADMLIIDGQINQAPVNTLPAPAYITSFGLNKVGPGKLVLKQNNLYTNITQVSAGILSIEADQALGTAGTSPGNGTYVSLGATLELNAVVGTGIDLQAEDLFIAGDGLGNVGVVHNVQGANIWRGAVILQSSSTINTDTGSSLTFQGVVSDPSGAVAPFADLKKNGEGTLILAKANTYRGITYINDGTLIVQDKDGLGPVLGGATFVADGASLGLDTDPLGNGGVTRTFGNEDLTIDGPGYNNQGALFNVSGINTWTRNITMLGHTSLGSVAPLADNLILDANLTDGGGVFNVTKVGPGSVEYAGVVNNSYTGLTQVTDGVLILFKNAGATPFGGNLTIGDTLGASDSASVVYLFDDQIPNTATVLVNKDGLLSANGHTDTLGYLRIVDGHVTTGAGRLNLQGLTGLPALDMTGGTIDLGSTGNLYLLSTLNATSSAGFTGAPAVITGGTFNLVTPGAALLSVNRGTQNLDLTVASSIVGSVDMTKAGGGIMQVLGGSVGFTGLTTVNGGTLQVDSSLGNITLAGGTLSGIGTVGTVGTTSGTSTVNPGDNSPVDTSGQLVAGTVTWSANTRFAVLLNDADTLPTPDYDRLLVDNITLNNASLVGTVGTFANIAENETFRIIEALGAGTVTGQFAQGSTVYLSGKKFDIIYGSNFVDLKRVLLTPTIAVTSNANPSIYTNPVTFTATLGPEAGSGSSLVTGNVEFTLDSFPTFIVAIVNNKASWTWDPSTLGYPPDGFGAIATSPHTLQVQYDGDADNNPATADPFAETIRDVDHPPHILTAIPSQVVDTGKSIKVYFQIADDDTSPLSKVVMSAKTLGGTTGIVSGMTLGYDDTGLHTGDLSYRMLTITGAAKNGSTTIQLTAKDDTNQTDVKTFALTVNYPPVVTIADASISHTQSDIDVPFVVTDKDNLSDSANLDLPEANVTVTTAAQKAYDLDTSLGLGIPAGGYQLNKFGAGEKRIAGSVGNKTYFIKPNGDFYEWKGSLAASTLITRLGAAYFTNPALLHDASLSGDPGEPTINTTVNVLTRTDGNISTGSPPSFITGNIHLNGFMGFVGTLVVTAVAQDPNTQVSKIFLVNVTNNAPTVSGVSIVVGAVTLPAPATLSHNPGDFDLHYTNANDTDGGDSLTYSATWTSVAKVAFDLNSTLSFKVIAASSSFNSTPARKLQSNLTKAIYYLTNTGAIYLWGGSVAASTQVAQLDATYYATTNKLTQAQAPGSEPSINTGAAVPITSSSGYLPVSLITSTFKGAVQGALHVSDGFTSIDKYVLVNFTNAAPTLDPIGNAGVSRSVGVLNVPFHAQDSDGDALVAGSFTPTVSTLPQVAWDLDKNLGLKYVSSTKTFGAAGDRKLQGITSQKFYYIRNTGEVYEWGGSVATSTQIAMLDNSYYLSNAVKLVGAYTTGSMRPTGPSITTQITSVTPSGGGVDGNLRITLNTPNFAGPLQVELAASDGIDTKKQYFIASFTNQAPTLFIPDTGNPLVEKLVWSMTQNGQLTVHFQPGDADGDIPTISLDSVSQDNVYAYQVDQRYGFSFAGSFYQNQLHQNEKRIKAADGSWYALVPNNGLAELHQVNKVGTGLAMGDLITTFDQAYYDNPSLLYNAFKVPAPTGPTYDSTLNLLDNSVTITGPLPSTRTFYVTLSATDGLATAKKAFMVIVTP